MAGEDQYWHENSGVIRREHGRNGGVVGHQRRTLATRTEVHTNTIDGCTWLAFGKSVRGRQRVDRRGLNACNCHRATIGCLF